MSARRTERSERPTVKRFIVKVQIDATGTRALIRNERGDIRGLVTLSAADATRAAPLDKWFQYATIAADGSIALESDAYAPNQSW